MNKPSHWTSQFSLSKNPFQDTIDTDFFYRTRQHEEASVKVRMGIEDKHALISLSGLSGTGKTLVSQVVLRSLDARSYSPVFVFVYPGMSKGALLGAILSELEISAPRFVQDRLDQLQERALALHCKGRRLVIIIDEAHFLKADALHVLRTLSNLETEKEKLITVLLVSEPSLNKRLKAPSYRSLQGRITFAVNLSPMNKDDVEQYVKYRLLKCGGHASMLPADVYSLIYNLSEGIPRNINRLLYASFIEAMAANENVSGPITEAAARKLGVVYG